jgi:hypothetical protein
MLLYIKLSNIYFTPAKSSQKHKGFTSPPYSFQLEKENRNFLKTNTRKWEIYKIAQDNVLMQKRLAETKSCFHRHGEDRNIKTSERGRSVLSTRENHNNYDVLACENEESNRQVVFKKLAYMNKLGLYDTQLYLEGNR